MRARTSKRDPAEAYLEVMDREVLRHTRLPLKITLLATLALAALLRLTFMTPMPPTSLSPSPPTIPSVPLGEMEILMPSVHRSHGSSYLATVIAAISSNPAPPRLSLYNANQPPEAHTELLRQCSQTAWMYHRTRDPAWLTCRNVSYTFAPQRLAAALSAALSRNATESFDGSLVAEQDRASDSRRKFLRWQTYEAYGMWYILHDALLRSPPLQRFVWLQDDMVVVPGAVWAALPRNEVMCMRVGLGYCGATAYSFPVWFASKLKARLESKLGLMPVDWLIDSLIPERPRSEYTARRANSVCARHIGLNSSNQQSREQDPPAGTRDSNNPWPRACELRGRRFDLRNQDPKVPDSYLMDEVLRG